MQSQIRAGISLAKALRVERGAVVSFVGGGGKTTSMFRLAAELCASGLRIVTTTTTHISKDQVHFSPAFVVIDELASLTVRLDEYGQCLVIGAPDGKGRVFGASSELIAALSARPDIDAVLVEADGSRSRPFKAPGEHEPAVPERTTILVPIVGINTIGQPLDEDHVHRSEAAAALAHVSVGSVITTETVARVLSHPEGGAKHRPAGARFVPLLNKADTDASLEQATELAGKLLASLAVDTVVISSMQQEPPVLEAWVPVAAIILATGQATLLGDSKQIPPLASSTLVAHSARTALDADLDPVIVVIGHDAENVEKALTGLPVQWVFDPEFAEGQSSSLRKGLDALPSRTGAALFLFADQPFVTSAMIRTLVQTHRLTFAPACIPVFEGQRGNPILFDKALFRELGELRGDFGGRVLLDKYADLIVTVPANPTVLLDIDTPKDYKKLKPEVRSQEPE
jgi:molybdenum cofactor cytidylyltransferase